MRPLRKRRKLLSKDDLRVWQHVTRSVDPLSKTSLLKTQDINTEPQTFSECKTLIEAESLEAEDNQSDPAFPLVRLRPKTSQSVINKKLSPLVHGSSNDMDKRTAQRFKKGNMVIDNRIDLHGMTRDGAHNALRAFMMRCVANKDRMVLVITGKGRMSAGSGVLKSEVPLWLNESPIRESILSFSYAQPKHGGDGALYVYLKRDRSR